MPDEGGQRRTAPRPESINPSDFSVLLTIMLILEKLEKPQRRFSGATAFL